MFTTFHWSTGAAGAQGQPGTQDSKGLNETSFVCEMDARDTDKEKIIIVIKSLSFDFL